MSKVENEQLEWIQSGVRRKFGSLVKNYVDDKERETTRQLEIRKDRLRNLLRKEKNELDDELRASFHRKHEEQLQMKLESVEVERQEAKELLERQIRLARQMQEREQCPDYREYFSKAVTARINASRPQEILMKNVVGRNRSLNL